MRTLNLTQIQVSATVLDLFESTLSSTAVFSREAGAIIDLTEAKEQVEDLNSILPEKLTIESLDYNNISYLELYL